MNFQDLSLIKVGGGKFMLQTKSAFSSFAVNDLQKAKDLYAQTLGIKVKESEMGLEILPGDTDVFIYPKPNHTPANFTVLNFLVDDIDKAVDELKKNGVRFEERRVGKECR